MKRKLRRVAALVCTLMLLPGMLPPTRAAGTVYFTAVNETVLELTDASMPFWANGDLYVASSAFSDKTLGISYSNNRVTQVATLYTSTRVLRFDLDAGTVTDAAGRELYPAARVRNSRVFLPVSLVAETFGLEWSNTQVKQGYVVRLRSEESVLSDRLFLDAADSLLEYRREQYLQAKIPMEDPVKPPEEPDDPPKPEQRVVYLCFRVGEDTEDLLTVLDGAGASAAVFFEKDQIAQYAPLIRRMAATGHAVGIMADADAPESAAEQLREANGLLWRAAGIKTRLCRLENASGADRTAARNEGVCCLRASVDRSSRGLRDASAAASLYSIVHSRGSDGVTVWLAENIAEAGLRAFLATAAESGDRLAALTETAA